MCVCVFCCITVAAQNDVEQRITVHPAGQDVELMYTLRQPFQSNESAGWIIHHSIPRGISFLVNGGERGYSADLLNNNLIIENIIMNDSRNESEYQCVITRTDGFNDQVVERGDIIILHVAGEYQDRIMNM